MTISERIRNLCNERGISVNQLEHESGVGRGNISRWDKNVPNVESVRKVAKYLNTSVDYLVGITEDEQVNEEETLKFALFGGGSNISDEMFEEVKQFAQFVKERERQRRFKEWEKQQEEAEKWEQNKRE